MEENATLIGQSKGNEALSYPGRGSIYQVDASTFTKNPRLHQEVFGPLSLLVRCQSIEELIPIIQSLEGQLTGTILGTTSAIKQASKLVEALKSRVGRLIFNGVPTGVEVCTAMQHGGPFPASTDARFTAVGVHSMKRWLRPISYQNWPDEFLPEALKASNPLGLWRLIDNQWTKN